MKRNIFLIFLLFLSFKALAQDGLKHTSTNKENNRNGLWVNQLYDFTTHTSFLDFDGLLGINADNRISEAKLRDYIKAYPEMFTSEHASNLRNAFPSVFNEEKEKNKQSKLNNR